MIDYESATSFLDEWGTFQQQVFFLLCLSVVPNGLAGFAIVFVGDTPAHRCLIPAHINLTAAWRNSSIPLEEDGSSGTMVPSQCFRYKIDELLRFSERGLMPGIDVNLSDVSRESCLDGWEYDRSVYTATITTEFDLVCENSWKNPLTSSVYFCGILVASFLSGQISDRYGRKIVLFVTLAVHSLFIFLQVFANSWAVFCALHFVVGMGQISNYVSAFVLGTELLGPRARTIFSTIGVNLFFDVGYMLLPLCAYLLRDWRKLLLCLSLPGFLCLPFWWFIPESPRWLVSQGRVKEAEAIVRDIAKRNKIHPPAVIFHSSEERKKRLNICDLLRSRNILPAVLLTIAYFVLSLNTANLYGDVYFNCFLSALVELPAYILSWVLFRWCSSRLSVSSSLIACGVLLLFVQLIPANLVLLAITLEMMGKFAVSTAYAFVYAYTAELYPTVLRNTAIGACSTASRIGSIIAPYFIYLRRYWTSLPYILMGSLTAVTGLLSLLLPESFGRPLPDTMAQMQHFPGDKMKGKEEEQFLLLEFQHQIGLFDTCSGSRSFLTIVAKFIPHQWINFN
uniref:Solute carrier family 22 member 5-like n=1 Tax=Cynoglossus semilaevis TaxID=244447 RepID=A0A3P8VYW1_CYNSE